MNSTSGRTNPESGEGPIGARLDGKSGLDPMPLPSGTRPIGLLGGPSGNEAVRRALRPAFSYMVAGRVSAGGGWWTGHAGPDAGFHRRYSRRHRTAAFRQIRGNTPALRHLVDRRNGRA